MRRNGLEVKWLVWGGREEPIRAEMFESVYIGFLSFMWLNETRCGRIRLEYKIK